MTRWREWADKCRAVVGAVPPAEEVNELRIIAYFEPPKSWSKKKRCAAIGERHRVKPDFDNIAKAVADALWPNDDSGIADARISKRYDFKARVEIEIERMP